MRPRPAAPEPQARARPSPALLALPTASIERLTGWHGPPGPLSASARASFNHGRAGRGLPAWLPPTKLRVWVPPPPFCQSIAPIGPVSSSLAPLPLLKMGARSWLAPLALVALLAHLGAASGERPDSGVREELRDGGAMMRAAGGCPPACPCLPQRLLTTRRGADARLPCCLPLHTTPMRCAARTLKSE